jgi:large subunit ribosomal protein L21
MTSIAIIKTGGKQYKVSEGDIINVEKIEKKDGAEIKFPALFIGDDKKVSVGNPEVKDEIVLAEVIEQTRGKKVVGIKHKPKKRQLKKFGHKQNLTKIKIIKIGK